MCGNCNDPFHDLDDDLSDLFGAPSDLDKASAFARDVLAPSKVTSTRTYEEKCIDCRGTGVWRSYSGYSSGQCFKCKGTGVRRYKTSAEQREKARVAAAEKRAREAKEALEAANAWLEANPVEAAWLQEPVRGDFTFHADMLAALLKYGHFTPKQETAVRNAAAKSAARRAQWAAEKAAAATNAPAVDVSLIEKAFASAQANGIKRPRMMLDGIKFSLAPAHGRNAGALYVVRKSDDQYLGKIMGGRFLKVRECTAEQEAEIVRIASNPHAEAVAYGKRTGVCCICGRELTNHASIYAGIGPICADKYGW